MYPPEENKKIGKSRTQKYKTLKHFAKKIIKKLLRLHLRKSFNCFSKTELQKMIEILLKRN